MVDEVVSLLTTNPDGTYLDLTAGAGGHLKAMAAVLKPTARLYGIDRDPEAIARVDQALGDCPQFRRALPAAYADLAEVAERFEDSMFDGLLLDLGLSSDQLDDAGRGFSFRFDGPLDMRFDPETGGRTAADLINSLGEKRLAEIIRDFGEERAARRLAAAIVRERHNQMILTTAQLSRIVTNTVRSSHQTKSLARVFQAFRIAVNGELEQLETVLPITLDHLKPGGRLAVLSYHSLEDRIVKRFFQKEAKGCLCPPRVPVCVCGHTPRIKVVTRKPVGPGENERHDNPRARSARLRVAERLSE